MPRLTRRELPSRILRTIHQGKGFQSSVYEVDWAGTRAAVKDFSSTPPLFRFFVAPLLAGREMKALQHLTGHSGEGTPGVPRFLGRVDRLAFALEFIEARPVSTYSIGELSPAEFAALFQAMVRTVEAIHARGVAHGDLKRRSNLLYAPDGQVWVIDFAASVVARGPVSRKLMRALAEVDDKSLPRLKKFVAPDLLTPEDRHKLDHPTSLERWARKLFNR